MKLQLNFLCEFLLLKIYKLLNLIVNLREEFVFMYAYIIQSGNISG